ncbi:MAG TPA: aldo/keto reductase, partial [Chloroflexi bacterium]|nr:aldo/keto reductase [Chloroflexota bacterium]
MRYAKLPSGAEMPMVGMGTWTLRGDVAVKAVQTALRLGYTHIDTAEGYGNQREIARAIEAAGV